MRRWHRESCDLNHVYPYPYSYTSCSGSRCTSRSTVPGIQILRHYTSDDPYRIDFGSGSIEVNTIYGNEFVIETLHVEDNMYRGYKGGGAPSVSSSWQTEFDVDPRVPTISVVISVNFRKFRRDVDAYVAGCKHDDRVYCGPRVLRNLRGDAARACEDIEISYIQEHGPEVIFECLARLAPEGTLRIIPRVYDALFRHTSFRNVKQEDGRSSMDVYLAELEYNKKQLEKEDKETSISSSVLGYFALLRSGLSERERTHVLGLCGNTFEAERIASCLRDLYPEGSLERRARTFGGTRTHGGYRDAYVTMPDDDQGFDDEPDMDPHGEVDHAEEYVANPEEQEHADGLQALLAMDPADMGDEHLAYAAELDGDLAEALVTMRESHARMNELKRQRGFFRGNIDGTFMPSGGDKSAKGGRGKGRGNAPASTSTKGGGKAPGDRLRERAQAAGGKGGIPTGVSDDDPPWKKLRATTRCLDCGRLGHWRGDPQCPKLGSSGARKRTAGANLAGLFGMACFDVDVSAGDDRRMHDAYASLPGGVSIADTGCTRAVAGRQWLQAWADRLKPFGLAPIITDSVEKFVGLGGDVKVSPRRWEFPVGIKGSHTTITFQEIDGDMPGLTAFDFNAGVVSLKDLGSVRIPLGPDGEHVALDYLRFDDAGLHSDAELNRFRTDGADSLPEVSDTVPFPLALPKPTDEDWNQLTGARGVLKRGQRRKLLAGIAELDRDLLTLRDHGRSFVWEFFAGTARLSTIVCDGGHIGLPPVDIRLGVDIADTAVQKFFLEQLNRYRPDIATFAFP